MAGLMDDFDPSMMGGQMPMEVPQMGASPMAPGPMGGQGGSPLANLPPEIVQALMVIKRKLESGQPLTPQEMQLLEAVARSEQQARGGQMQPSPLGPQIGVGAPRGTSYGPA